MTFPRLKIKLCLFSMHFVESWWFSLPCSCPGEALSTRRLEKRNWQVNNARQYRFCCCCSSDKNDDVATSSGASDNLSCHSKNPSEAATWTDARGIQSNPNPPFRNPRTVHAIASHPGLTPSTRAVGMDITQSVMALRPRPCNWRPHLCLIKSLNDLTMRILLFVGAMECDNSRININNLPQCLHTSVSPIGEAI